MFEHLQDDIDSSPRIKCIYFMQNGNPDQTFQYTLQKPITKSDITEIMQKKWPNEKYKNVRVFSCDAVEYFDEDLLFLKNGDRLFISKGEDFDSNRNFGEYQIIKLLGQGGFGSVSLAKNRVTHEYAAIKVVKANRLSSSSCIDMIFKEAENLKSLTHPNIVKILNCYALKNMKFVVVMEYLEGGQLKQLLRKKQKFSQEQARFYFKQIISAVSYCHREGVVHRDLKLENILLTKDSKIIKVADFGISGMADRFNPELDWGTLKFMPPEILGKKEKTNSFAGDVWACGIILFYLVQGYLPFTGDSSAKITKKIIQENLEFPQNCNLSQNCRNLIERMLQKNPKTRIKMNDIIQHSWFELGAEENKIIEKKSTSHLVSQQLKKKELFIKRKSLKNNSVQIPYRLQREKHRLTEQLNIYRNGRKFFRPQTKILPEIGRHNRFKTSKLKEADFRISMRNSKILTPTVDIFHTPESQKKFLLKQSSFK